MFPKASETFIFNLIKELESCKYIVTICATMKSNDEIYYTNNSFDWKKKIIYFNSIKWLLLKNLLTDCRIIKKALILFLKTRSLKKLYTSLKRWYFINYNKPDLVHFMFSSLGITFNDVIQTQKSSKVVMSCRGPDEFFLPLYNNSYSKSISTLIAALDQIHCVSNEIAKKLVPFGASTKQLFINYPAVDINTFNLKDDRNYTFNLERKSAFNVLSVGRLQSVKGFQFSIFAVKSMKDMGINVKYNIYGSGPELGFLLYIINSVNLQDDVSIHDHVNQVELLDAYNNAHVFLLSSTVEGVSNAALEAAATGLPIVSTKLEGMNELFAHQESIYFTESIESNDLLAGLLYFYNNPDLANNIGLNASKIVYRKLTLKRQIDNFVKLYEKLI